MRRRHKPTDERYIKAWMELILTTIERWGEYGVKATAKHYVAVDRDWSDRTFDRIFEGLPMDEKGMVISAWSREEAMKRLKREGLIEYKNARWVAK